MSIRSVVYSVLVPLAVFAGSALGATLQVPSLQYPTIQSAINAAASVVAWPLGKLFTS